MKYKYIILDFGNVLVTPTTGNWDITPKFLKLIDVDKINIDKFKEVRNKFKHILSEKITTLEEEQDMFFRFYDSILSNIDYPNYNSSLALEIAKDRTYNFDKYKICDHVIEELTLLKEKYILILLSDNWPCVIPYMKHFNIFDYFDKIYVSSIYGVEKKDKTFFDFPIKDFDIKFGEALFIDDNEVNLAIAQEKGLDVMLMDRHKRREASKYKIINDLFNI